MKTARRLAVGLALASAGCMTGAQTLEQDLALQRWKRCDTFATIALQRITTEGRVVVTGREGERTEFMRCMAAEASEQRRSKPDLVVPEPLFRAVPP